MNKHRNAVNYSFDDFIRQHRADITDTTLLSADELGSCRREYIEHLIREETGELGEVEKSVARSISQHRFISPKKKKTTDPGLGSRLADKVAAFGGSWKFIISFFAVLIAWMAVNVVLFNNKGFDPYPFILLNLILSCTAAIQAPIIMMSQNRTEEKDRERAEQDYMTNLKAEVEIRMLHEKMDYILNHQNKRLIEIQRLQVEMMENISKRLDQMGRA
ncbi:MAG: DUF1003 domain-containing protein [Chitinophagaceae bacterium]|nr:MAG: DUF1003 domain-containing protein [Chitinophagaceae bacterium]